MRVVVKLLMALWGDKPDRYAELYPKMLELSRYGEYKAPVLSFLRDLLDFRGDQSTELSQIQGHHASGR